MNNKWKWRELKSLNHQLHVLLWVSIKIVFQSNTMWTIEYTYSAWNFNPYLFVRQIDFFGNLTRISHIFTPIQLMIRILHESRINGFSIEWKCYLYILVIQIHFDIILNSIQISKEKFNSSICLGKSSFTVSSESSLRAPHTWYWHKMDDLNNSIQWGVIRAY